MTKYRFVGTTLYRRGEIITTGDVIEPSEAELDAFGDVLEPVEDDGAGDSDADEANDDSDDDSEADSDGDGDVDAAADDICGAEKSDGSICERDPDACPYHDTGDA